MNKLIDHISLLDGGVGSHPVTIFRFSGRRRTTSWRWLYRAKHTARFPAGKNIDDVSAVSTQSKSGARFIPGTVGGLSWDLSSESLFQEILHVDARSIQKLALKKIHYLLYGQKKISLLYRLFATSSVLDCFIVSANQLDTRQQVANRQRQ